MPRPSKRRTALYQAAIREAERLAFEQARQMEGLDDEIALLRLRLLQQIRDGGLEAMAIRDLELLVRALRARRDLNRSEDTDWPAQLTTLLEGLASGLAPQEEE